MIKQIWDSKIVDKSVFLGLMSGYLSLGLIAFFMFLAIESSFPNSFDGLSNSIINGASFKNESLLYYSFITLLTIGYGEITPLTAMAQKASILTGLMGQFYIVIVTAVVIGKYISNPKKL
ncbi:MAG: ion channel [Flavobacteriaceae bacterium]